MSRFRGAKVNGEPITIGVDTMYGATRNTFNGLPIKMGVGVHSRHLHERSELESKCIATRYAEVIAF